jgi:hypothetical protein
MNLALEWIKQHSGKIEHLEKLHGIATDDKVVTLAILYKGTKSPKSVLRKSLLFDTVWEVEVSIHNCELIKQELCCNWFLKNWRKNINAFLEAEKEDWSLQPENQLEILMQKKMLH